MLQVTFGRSLLGPAAEAPTGTAAVKPAPSSGAVLKCQAASFEEILFEAGETDQPVDGETPAEPALEDSEASLDEVENDTEILKIPKPETHLSPPEALPSAGPAQTVPASGNASALAKNADSPDAPDHEVNGPGRPANGRPMDISVAAFSKMPLVAESLSDPIQLDRQTQHPGSVEQAPATLTPLVTVAPTFVVAAPSRGADVDQTILPSSPAQPPQSTRTTRLQRETPNLPAPAQTIDAPDSTAPVAGQGRIGITAPSRHSALHIIPDAKAAGSDPLGILPTTAIPVPEPGNQNQPESPALASPRVTSINSSPMPVFSHSGPVQPSDTGSMLQPRHPLGDADMPVALSRASQPVTPGSGESASTRNIAPLLTPVGREMGSVPSSILSNAMIPAPEPGNQIHPETAVSATPRVMAINTLPQAAVSHAGPDQPSDTGSLPQTRFRHDNAAMAAPEVRAPLPITPSVGETAPASLQSPFVPNLTNREAWPSLSFSSEFDPPLELRSIPEVQTSLRTGADAVSPRAELPRHMSQQLAEAVHRGAKLPVELHLNPVELGRVRISLQASDGSVTVHIAADRPETLDLMRRHTDLLAQDFRAIGYSKPQFFFAQNGSGDGGGQFAAHRQQDSDQSGSPARPPDTDPNAPTIPALEISDRVDIRI